MKPAARRLLLLGCAAALAIPAIAQVQNEAAPTPAPSTPAPAASQPSRQVEPQAGATAGDETTVAIEDVAMQPPPPPIEYPRHARRNPFAAGAIDPVRLGIGADPWGQASGVFLETLMRQMDTPLASRWAHIALRNALLASARSPRGVNPVDWAAERAWLLLRMGEADAARLLIADIDSDRFTPKMAQVALQSALANSDPLAMCPLTDRLRRVESRVLPLVQAICSALNGEPESAAAQIDSARRRGPIGGIDLTLAQKVVGAASDTGTATTIEWEPVDALTAWRFGLATATAMSPPERLIDSASPQLHAWFARAPLIPMQQRLESARIATGLGVFSSQALSDFYSWIYDSTDPNDLSGTDSWQLRLAFAAKDQDERLSAMRRLWEEDGDRFEREASRALLGRAAARIPPSVDLETDASELIASMLAAGMDREAMRWANAVRQMEDEPADRAWAMLALAAPEGARVDLSVGRVNAFIGRDNSEGKKRSALLVAGLAALGKLDIGAASRLNARYRLYIERASPWTQMVDAAARRRQPGSVLVLAGTGFQARDWDSVPSAHLFHVVMALRNTEQDFAARMIAAEALART
ncbi:MAG TPA: hypothetical protein VFU80_08830 [Sphingomicrobium sp.]|nr:hypothetical protein [Sphingomicrobium sp.]